MIKVSKNDNCHCAGTTKVVVSHGKECLKKKALHEWVSSFLTAHQHNICYAVSYY